MKLRVVLSSWILVFFLQALRVIFSTMFGVIYDQIFEGPLTAWLPVSVLLVILALLAPGLIARRNSKRALTILAVVVSLARIGLSINDASFRYWSALMLLAAGGSYLALCLRRDSKGLGQALIWGLLVEYTLRVLGDSFDWSLHDGSLVYVAFWVGLAVILALYLDRRESEREIAGPGIAWPLALAFGVFLFLETTLLALPSAVARYSSLDYPLIAILLFIASAGVLIPGLPGLLDPLLSRRRTQVILMTLGAVGFLVGYFLDGWLAAVGLILSQLIVIVSMLYIMEGHTAHERATHWRLSLGMILMLVLNFFSAFAFTYPYTLSLMRDQGWLVHLAALIILSLGVIAIPLNEAERGRSDSRLPSTLALVFVAIIVVGVWPRTPEVLPDGTLRVATWNIHYGYDDDWHTNLQEMATVIADEGVDVIALQEVDTGRMTSYSSDNAYFLARRLGMQVVYLPAVEHLTGIALLYKGSRAPSDLTFVTSTQEQTGVVHAALNWGSSGLDAYGIWMGLSDEDTLRQIDEALAFIGPKSTAVFGGDFNANPGDPEIDAVRATGFADPFALLGVENPAPTSPAIDPQSRIDFVWLRGLIPQRAWVSESLASDHRMVVVEVSQP